MVGLTRALPFARPIGPLHDRQPAGLARQDARRQEDQRIRSGRLNGGLEGIARILDAIGTDHSNLEPVEARQPLHLRRHAAEDFERGRDDDGNAAGFRIQRQQHERGTDLLDIEARSHNDGLGGRRIVEAEILAFDDADRRRCKGLHHRSDMAVDGRPGRRGSRIQRRNETFQGAPRQVPCRIQGIERSALSDLEFEIDRRIARSREIRDKCEEAMVASLRVEPARKQLMVQERRRHIVAVEDASRCRRF